ncbi:unnamed protein product [Microthlaspi erraticum]|uniref:Uncharacterized protein n=1 Tax=Microthlaspi erraticum TaxID=1685480 RepID=A0A6D2JPP9_9BRAS|nr:unnamed protein product [Microthlaspi erraticum]CAA7045952.1 unnamed protein product [Microthlaspi erraticum]
MRQTKSEPHGKRRSWKNWLIPKRQNHKINAAVCGGARKKARSKFLGRSDWRLYRSETKRISTGEEKKPISSRRSNNQPENLCGCRRARASWRRHQTAA